MKKIKMVGLDLDGTTFNEQKKISAVNRQAIAEAICQGVVVLPATGRPLIGLPKEMTDIPGVIYAVTSNGGAVYDLRTKETIYTACIPNKKAIAVAKMLMGLGELPEVYTDGVCYVNAKGYDIVQTYDIPEALKEYIKVSRIKVDDLIGFLEETGKDVHKMHVLFDLKKQGARAAAFEAMKQFEGLNVSSAMPYNMEINSDKADKGSALIGLGQMLGIERDEIMAIGDAKNDLPMLTKAGFSVAMGNADDDVKKYANAVTLTNEEDGVAWALRKWVLE